MAHVISVMANLARIVTDLTCKHYDDAQYMDMYGLCVDYGRITIDAQVISVMAHVISIMAQVISVMTSSWIPKDGASSMANYAWIMRQ